MSSLKTILDRINNLDQALSSLSDSEDSACEGTFNKITFKHFNHVELKRGKRNLPPPQLSQSESQSEEEPPYIDPCFAGTKPVTGVKIAVSSHKSATVAHKDALSLLHSRRVPSRFVHLPWTSSSSTQVFEMAPKKSLINYFCELIDEGITKGTTEAKAVNEKYERFAKNLKNSTRSHQPMEMEFFHKITPQELRQLFAQVILQLADLHHSGISHGDVKIGNILVFIVDGKIHLKIGDTDGAAKIDEKGQGLGVNKTPGPPIIDLTPHKLPREGEPIYLTAWDGFGLWQILCTLYALSEKDTSNKTDNLMRKLYDTDAGKAFEIDTIKDDVFFGDTPEEREQLFQDLNGEFDTCDYIDGYYVNRVFLDENLSTSTISVTSPQENEVIAPSTTQAPVTENDQSNKYDSIVSAENDAFLLLPTLIKSIFVLCKDLDNQLDYFDALVRGDFESERYTKGRDDFTLEYKKVLDAVQNKQKQIQEEIKKLKKIPNCFGFTKDIKKLKAELAKHEKRIEMRSHLFNQIQKCKDISAQDLVNAVNNAVTQYIEVNHLNTQRPFLSCLFSCHGQKGKKHAEALKEKVKKMFDDGNSAKDIAIELNKFFATTTSGNSKNSFQIILSQKLKGLSELPRNLWLKFLSDKSVTYCSQSSPRP